MKRNNYRCFLIDDDSSGIYCKDGEFRRTVFFGTVSSACKFWKSKGWAVRTADKLGLNNFTIKMVYDGESVDCHGLVTKGETNG